MNQQSLDDELKKACNAIPGTYHKKNWKECLVYAMQLLKPEEASLKKAKSKQETPKYLIILVKVYSDE